jgi:glucokinase
MGNFGHMPAEPESTRICYCGCHGCLEVEAGGRALVNQMQQILAAGEPSILSNYAAALTVERIAWAAEQKDSLARGLLVRAVKLVARALAGVLALLNPDTVVFGGGVSRCLSAVRREFQSELARLTPNFSVPSGGVLESEFSDRAGAVGAALLPLSVKRVSSMRGLP